MSRTVRSSRAGPTLTDSTPSISNFARVSKVSAGQAGLGVKKIVGEEYVASVGSKKRKVVASEDESGVTKRTKKTCAREDKKNAGDVVAEGKKTRLFQDVTKLKAQPSKKGVSVGTKKTTSRKGGVSKTSAKGKNKPTTSHQSSILDMVKRMAAPQPQASKDASGLPPHLAELVSLHKAFLKIVSLQFAHNGTNVPLDLKLICPNISRAWGKRTVTVDDIRTCVAVEGLSGPEAEPSPLIVSSYGAGKVCVELDPELGAAASIKEDELCRRFEANLRALSAERAADEMSDLDVPLANLSLADLPMAPIIQLGSGLRLNPMLARGYRALAEIKGAQAARQQGKQEAADSNASMTNPDGSKMSLLDRVRAKSLARSQLAPALSGPELRRRGALMRVEDVAATISMLSLQDPKPRLAFPMSTLLQNLMDSARMPLSAEDGKACVEAMAAEVAPEWIQIIVIGGRANVVVQRARQPVDRVLRERVAKLLSA